MTYHISQKVLFRHCDPAGIVFYPRYFEMVNDAVEAFFDDVVEVPFHTMHESHGVPTVKLDASFVMPSRHGDQLDIEVEPKRIGGSSLELSVKCRCRGEDRFSVDVTLVYVTKDMRAQRWTKTMREAMNSKVQLEANCATHD